MGLQAWDVKFFRLGRAKQGLPAWRVLGYSHCQSRTVSSADIVPEIPLHVVRNHAWKR